MKKIIEMLPIVVVAVAVSLITVQIVEKHKAKKEQEAEPSVTTAQKVSVDELPVSKEAAPQDRALLEQAFKVPEALDAAVASNSLISPVPPQRPPRMSEANLQEPTNKLPAGDDQYFQKDFESLRTDAVKNPDSEQNRETIGKLMEMRQRRLNGEN